MDYKTIKQEVIEENYFNPKEFKKAIPGKMELLFRSCESDIWM